MRLKSITDNSYAFLPSGYQLDLASEKHRNVSCRRKRMSKYFNCCPLLARLWCSHSFVCIHSSRGVTWLFSLCCSFSLIPRTASSPQSFRPDGGNSSQWLLVPWWLNSTSLNSLHLTLWLCQLFPAGTPAVRVVTTRGIWNSSLKGRVDLGTLWPAVASLQIKLTPLVVWDEGQVEGKFGS